MNTKLTLTIEDSIIYGAKAYAKSKKDSLSNIIENYLKALVKEENKTEIELTPFVKSLMGTFHIEQEFDYKKELSKRLAEKYT